VQENKIVSNGTNKMLLIGTVIPQEDHHPAPVTCTPLRRRTEPPGRGNTGKKKNFCSNRPKRKGLVD
jgi:hypothetical protein